MYGTNGKDGTKEKSTPQIPPSAPLDSASPIGEASLVAGPLRLWALPRGRPASPIGAPSWQARFAYRRSLVAGPLRLSALPRGRPASPIGAPSWQAESSALSERSESKGL